MTNVPVRARLRRGFTLIELLVLVVVFSGALVTLAAFSAQTARQQGQARAGLQVALALQEAGERLLAVRRRAGYSAMLDPVLLEGWVDCGNYTVSGQAPLANPPLANLELLSGHACRLWASRVDDGDACAELPDGCFRIDLELRQGDVTHGRAALVLGSW